MRRSLLLEIFGSRRRVLFALALSLVALGVSARAILDASRTAWKKSDATLVNVAARASAQQGQAREPVETEIVTVRPHGLEPAEITRPKGAFNLRVENRSGLTDDLDVSLARADGEKFKEKVKEVRMKKGRVNWREQIDLPPGEYLLTVGGRPEWSLRLTITH